MGSTQYIDFSHNLQTTTIPATTPFGGFALNAQDSDGKTQLHRVISSGDTGLVRTLLFNGIAVDIKDHAGNEPLHCGVIADELEIVKFLLRFGANVNAKNQLGRTPLHLARSRVIVDAFCQKGAAVSSQDHKGDTPLHLALSKSPGASRCNWVVVRALLDSRADLNLVNDAGITPFHKLLYQPYEDTMYRCVISFIDSGANVTKLSLDNKMPLQMFLESSKDKWSRPGEVWEYRVNEVLRRLLAEGADPATPLPGGEPTILYYFKRRFDDWSTDGPLAELLCKVATPGQVTGSGNGLLHELSLMCQTGYQASSPKMENLMDILLQNGEDPNRQNRRGETPLLLLFMEKKNIVSVVKRAMITLLEYRADPLLRDSLGNCALFEAAKRFPIEDIKCLLTADLRQRERARQSSKGDGYHADRVYWREWELAVESENWGEAKNLILDGHGSLPEDIDKRIRLGACTALAEKHVQMTKDRFSIFRSEVERKRSYVAGILRDCRLLDIKPDSTCFDCLINLCL
jgi:ankyrin repeat protein